MLQFLIHPSPPTQPIKDSQQPQYYHFTRQNQLTLTVLNRDFPSLVLCFKEDLNKFECCTRGGYLVEKFIVKGCDEMRHEPCKWQATNISSSSPIERSPLFIFNRNNRSNKRNRSTFTCSWRRNYNQDIFCCEKLQLRWTMRIVLRFQKVSETTWFSGQNTFIDNWHIAVHGISRNRLYMFPRIFQKYVKSTKMENVGLLLSSSKFKRLKIRSFIIAVLSKDKTVISRKNQIFVIMAWTVSMLIMAGWRVLVLFLHCPDGVSTRCDAMRAPLERNKRPRVCTRSYEAKKQEKRGSGATTCNKTWGEPTELRPCTYKNRPFWLRLENESFADVMCMYYYVLCMYILARKF